MEKWIDTLIQGIINLLPKSPFREFIDTFVITDGLQWLNWFIPVSEILTILTIWLTAVALFYLYSVIMRWVKLIGG